MVCVWSAAVDVVLLVVPVVGTEVDPTPLTVWLLEPESVTVWLCDPAAAAVAV